MKDSIESEVIATIRGLCPECKKAKINEGTALIGDLGFDSLKLLSLALELERRLGLELDRMTQEIDFTEIRSIGDVFGIVHRYSKRGKPPR